MKTIIMMKWYDFLDWYDYNKKKTWFIGLILTFLVGFGVYVNTLSLVEQGTEEPVYLEENIHKSEDPVVEPTVALEEEIVKVIKPPEVVESRVESGDNSVSVLLLGVDSRNKDFIGRSDSMILLTANKEDKNVKLVSIPRDSYVWIEKKGFRDKITHANAFGGQETAVKTVEDLFGITIDHAVTINFDSFVEVVDILDGVEVEVPFSFTERTTTGDTAIFTKGTQVLNGDEALAYARMRKQDPKGDLGRGERQQQIIESIIIQAASFSSVSNFKDLYEVAKNNVKTDVGLLDIVGLVPHIQSVGNIEKLTLSGGGKKINGVYYYQLDEVILEDVRNELQNHLGEGEGTDLVNKN
jgi:LCP family protein required for cell wall assembly